MATQNYINECKNRANANRLAKFNIGNLAVNQTNYLKSIKLEDSCYVNDTIIGSMFTKSIDVELLNIPANTELVGETITPEIGVRYTDDSTEYITFDDYIVESVNDEQTASNTKFTAMNGGTLLDKEYNCSLSFENGTTHTINEFYQDACSQIGLTPTDATFDNSEIVMTGNPFTNKETIRTVLAEVEKTSCNILDFDWNNGTVTMTWLSNQIDYEFTTSDYSTIEGSLAQYGPLNTIILGNSQLNGENVVMVDQQSVDTNGEHQIMIDASYFLYSEELRRQAITAIYNKLDGLTYYDIKLTTPYGKPFLKIGNKIRINTNENQVYDTYILKHTFTYDGTFESIIESPALTSEEQTIKNIMQGNSIKERIQRTEVTVNKITGETEAINQRVTSVEDGFGNVYTKEETNDLIANSETGLTNTFTNSGGNNIFRNTGLWFEQRSEENKYSYNISGSGLGISYNFNRDTITLNGTTTDSGIIADLTTETLLIPAGEYTFTSTNLSGKFIRNNRDTAIYFRNLNNQTVISILGENNYEKNATLVFNEDTLLHPMLYANGSGMVFENLTISLKIVENNLYYEFWNGLVERISEEKAINRNALLLKQGTLEQEQQVPNGNYTVSFNYEKLVELATVRVIINGVGYELSEMEDTEFEQTIQVSTQNIDVQFVSDTDDSCKVYDLMVNKGDTKATYTQNQNETTTDTVNISKGITITSSEVDTTFKANADGVRIYANSDMENPKTWFTEKGTTTENLIVNEEAQITGLLHRRVGDHVWVTKI